MKKIILFAMLFVASISFANTVSEERVDLKTTTTETKEVSNDSSSIKTMGIESAEDYEVCITTVWIVVLDVQYLPFSRSYLITYEDWSYTTCYTL